MISNSSNNNFNNYMIKKDSITGKDVRAKYALPNLKTEVNINKIVEIVRLGSNSNISEITSPNIKASGNELAEAKLDVESQLQRKFDFSEAQISQRNFDDSRNNLKSLITYLTAELKPQPFFGSKVLKASMPMPTRSGKDSITGESVLQFLRENVSPNFNIDHAMQLIGICMHRDHRPLLEQKYTTSVKSLLHKLDFNQNVQNSTAEIREYTARLSRNQLFVNADNQQQLSGFDLVNTHFNAPYNQDKNQTLINKFATKISAPEAKKELENLLAFSSVFLRGRYSNPGTYSATLDGKSTNIYINYENIFKYVERFKDAQNNPVFTRDDAVTIVNLCAKKHATIDRVTTYSQSAQAMLDAMNSGSFQPDSRKLRDFKQNIQARNITNTNLVDFLRELNRINMAKSESERNGPSMSLYRSF